MGYFFFIPSVLSPGTAERCTFESPHERIPPVYNVDANTFCRQHLKLVFNNNNKKKELYKTSANEHSTKHQSAKEWKMKAVNPLGARQHVPLLNRSGRGT